MYALFPPGPSYEKSPESHYTLFPNISIYHILTLHALQGNYYVRGGKKIKCILVNPDGIKITAYHQVTLFLNFLSMTYYNFT